MSDAAEVDRIVVETKTPQPYPAVIPASDLATLRADLAAARADAAAWRRKYAELRQIVLLVEDYSDATTPANAQALLDAFRAFRKLVEGDTPRAWGVAAVIDDWDAGEDAAADGDVPW